MRACAHQQGRCQWWRFKDIKEIKRKQTCCPSVWGTSKQASSSWSWPWCAFVKRIDCALPALIAPGRSASVGPSGRREANTHYADEPSWMTYSDGKFPSAKRELLVSSARKVTRQARVSSAEPIACTRSKEIESQGMICRRRFGRFKGSALRWSRMLFLQRLIERQRM
jgi:hypothetical protein